jgi:hypothetical protein
VQNLTAQKVMLALITLGFFIASPWLISETIGGNTTPLVLIFGLGLLLIFLFVLKDRCWMMIPFSMPIEGNLNFLPLNFTIYEISILYVMAYMLLQKIMGREIQIRLGPAFFWIPLAGVLAIHGYHWVQSGDIGIRSLGGTGWGGRTYFKLFFYALTVPLICSFSGSSWKDFQRVPLVFFLGTFVDIVPQTISTLIPATAPYIFRVYSGVNIGEYSKEIAGAFGGHGITRIGQFGKVGYALGLLVVSYFPFYTWLNPARLWVLPSLVLAFLCSAFSGFRSSIFNFCMAVFGGIYATARWRALLLIPVGALAIAVVAASQKVIVDYPDSIQRALSFLPGQWNPAPAAEAKDSSKWRVEMRELFFSEYFQKAPLIGLGYHFDSKFALEYQDVYLRIAQLQTNDPYHMVRGFIERRNPHEGDLHLLLTGGIFVMVFFVIFCLSLVFFVLKILHRTPVRQIAPLETWATALIIQQVAAFFVVYGDLAPTLGSLCPIFAILYAAEKLRPAFETSTAATIPPPMQPGPVLSPSHAWGRPRNY